MIRKKILNYKLTRIIRSSSIATIYPYIIGASILVIIIALFVWSPSDSTPIFPGTTISIASGIFKMGSNDGDNDEQPIHKVRVNNFSISKYEITNAQYAVFMNAIGANANGRYKGIEYLEMNDEHIEINYINGKFVADTSKENHPVIEVSWYGAKAYCTYYGGRLPTEAEWEFAAKGGNKHRGYTYAGSDNADEVAWYHKNSGNTTKKVGTKNSNELDLYDMSGNVSEWCNDWYDKNYYKKPVNNSKGPTSGAFKVIRGGFWNFNLGFIRVTDRSLNRPTSTSTDIGFRFVFPLIQK